MWMGKTHHKLSATEREQIAVYLSQKLSKRAIAKRLGRSDSTIRLEITRHLTIPLLQKIDQQLPGYLSLPGR